MPSYILSIDQGTTSSRAMIFDGKLRVVAAAQREFRQIFPRPGWVEHDPEEIWQSVVATCRAAIRKAGIKPAAIAGIGITNQRETTVLWNRKTGKPIHRAIVWQDRRTADVCAALRAAGHEPEVASRTGLLLDPYFSGTKVGWLLDHVKGARQRAERGDLRFGTIELFPDLAPHRRPRPRHRCHQRLAHAPLQHPQRRVGRQAPVDLRRPPRPPPESQGLRRRLRRHRSRYPRRRHSHPWRRRRPAGRNRRPGMLRAGHGQIDLWHRLLRPPQYRRHGGRVAQPSPHHDRVSIERPAHLRPRRLDLRCRRRRSVASRRPQTRQARLRHRCAGEEGRSAPEGLFRPCLGRTRAPYWDADARGAIYGITRGTTAAEIARATLESVCYQTSDLIDAMRSDHAAGAPAETVLRVDGGMVASDWTMQFLADILEAPVDRPKVLETTAVGAAYLAGLQAGLYPPPEDFARTWKRDRRFTPRMTASERAAKLAGWRDAVRRTLTTT